MFKKISFVLITLILSVLCQAVLINSGKAIEPFCRYQLITHIEATRFNEVINFWTPDTLTGRIHSNDMIGIRHSPHFLGQVSTSASSFVYAFGDPYFEYPPQFGAPLRRFPNNFTEAREEGLVIGDPDDRLQYRLVLDDRVVQLYGWASGMPFREVDSLRLDIEIEEYPLIFIDSPLELMGVLEGVLTVGSSDDILLIDDVRYASANQYGYFDPDECEDMLGVVSEGNIIIANTLANGKENGFAEGGGNMQRHSIALDGAFLALGESFSFQHQNDDFEAYQGPEPDERGIIHLTGSIAQFRRGYVHRSNHGGTGYGRDYRHDPRFDDQSPPFFPEVVRYDIPGTGNILSLEQEAGIYHFEQLRGEGGYDSIYAEAGVEVVLHDTLYLRCDETLTLMGTEDEPIVINRQNPDDVDRDALGLKCNSADIVMSNVEFGSGVKMIVGGRGGRDGVYIEDCVFNSGLEIDIGPGIAIGDVILVNCIITGEADFRVNNLTLDNCQFYELDSVNFAGEDLSMVNCNVTGKTVFHVEDLILSNCEFNDEVTFIHDSDPSVLYNVSHITFHSGLSVVDIYNLGITNSVVESGMWMKSVYFAIINNNNFVHSDSAGMMIVDRHESSVFNNTFAYNRYGLVSIGEELSAPYNSFWDNDTNYIGIDPNLGSIYENPRFVDPDNGDYHLQWNSPCIDAGDPNSELDPDGTRADIGAFYRDRNQGVDDEMILPERFAVTASPNPFNSSVTLQFSLSAAKNVELTVFDLTGREIFTQTDQFSAGVGKMIVSGELLGSAGVYFARVEIGNDVRTVKLVYMP